MLLRLNYECTSLVWRTNTHWCNQLVIGRRSSRTWCVEQRRTLMPSSTAHSTPTRTMRRSNAFPGSKQKAQAYDKGISRQLDRVVVCLSDLQTVVAAEEEKRSNQQCE